MAPMRSLEKRDHGKRPTMHPKNLKRKRDDDNFDALEERTKSINMSEDKFEYFKDLPLSKPTASGLEASHYQKLTDIQARAIPHALKGADILGAAKTGSGKTLAFLIPVLERLHRQRWTDMDGLGALILSPTRELAVQIFEVLRKIGRYHSFSAGLVIGGKDLVEERERLGRMNILVCTPGRMLQHMDQTSTFDTGNLHLLVLDEADRIMDMGFQSSVDAIIEHLPKERQTLLFSATQTKKVSDLARLSLQNPEYVSVHETATSATPAGLQQNYIISPLPDKLDTLWSFLRSNLKAKILVFLSSGKQVRFVYEAFRHMQPGLSLMHIHGRQKQSVRMQTIDNFSASKHSCLFSTDIAARGLDIPAVDWVVQLDCPEDAETYIHRVGRTARYERNGRAVLFLDPSEELGILQRLEQKKVAVEKISVRQKKQQSIKNQLQNMCFKDPELKYLGQKAFVSYVRSVHLQKDKEIFNLAELALEDFASSLGLPGAPRIKFLKGDHAKDLKNRPRQHDATSSEADDSSSNNEKVTKPKKSGPRTKYDRMFERRNQDVLADHYTRLVDQTNRKANGNTSDADEDEEFLNVRSRLAPEVSSDEGDEESRDTIQSGSAKFVAGLGKDPILVDSKRKEKLLKSKKKLLKLKEKGKKLLFDEEGKPHEIYELEDEDQFKQRGDAITQKSHFLENEQERLQVADRVDKEVVKSKRREKREKRKARELLDDGNGEGATEALLVPFDGDQGEDLDAIDLFAKSTDSKPAIKKAKKWFEDASDEEQRHKDSRANKITPPEPDTLEDLEAMASGLLA